MRDVCTKKLNGKELTLLEILGRLEDKKHQRQLIATSITYSRQEIKSARTVLDRLLVLAPSGGDSTTVHHSSVRG